MVKTYTKGVLKGHTYDFGNLSKEKIRNLENAFASNALEGFDNIKINQYLINEAKNGIDQKTSLQKIKLQIQNNPDAFLAQFD